MIEPKNTDERIAVEVMGWKLFGGGRYQYLHEDGTLWTAPIPAFSTDFAQAWRVVEKMIEDGFDFSLCRIPTRPWSVRFERDSVDDEDLATPEALPALICKMALDIRSEWEKHWR